MEKLFAKKREYLIIKKTRDYHDFSEFLVTYKNKKFIAKKYVLTSKLVEDVKTRKSLMKCGIFAPKYKKIDKKQNITIEQFIEGQNALSKLVEGDLPDEFYQELFNVYRFCRFSKIEINYFPENFILGKKKMYYTSFDCRPQDEKYNLENYGLYYWIYSSELVTHLKELGIKEDKSRLLSTPEVKKKIVLLSVMNW